MAKGKLFEYAILYHPGQTKADRDAGQDTKSVILKPPTTVIAGDETAVRTIAAREIPQDYLDKLDKVEVVVRPF